MRPADRVIATLESSGELWESAPGVVGLRGHALARLRDIESRLTRICRGVTADEWLVPPAISLDVLERADYFASFPHWLTLASHLPDDERSLEWIATSSTPAREAAIAGSPALAAMPPAVCYHVYSALAGQTIRAPRIVTAQGTCWRHEGGRLAPLSRGWAFTMREIVYIGTEEGCVAFRDRGVEIAGALARDLRLRGRLEPAEDPFFAPTGRGRAIIQRLKSLKHELRLPIGAGETVAAASFNLHERFFGDAFDLRLKDGSPAWTACVAFGLERWLLASLAAAQPPVTLVTDLEESLR